MGLDEGATKEELESLKSSVEDILDICAINEVDIPEDLKGKVLGRSPEDDDSKLQTESLKSKVKERRSETDDVFMKDLRERTQILGGPFPHLDIRVKDASYTAINRYPDEKESTDEEDQGPRRAKQKIDTFANHNPITKVMMYFWKCIKNRGPVRVRKEEVKILQDVNLVFEPGKMYLVLGAPGSGKSTLLKTIAQTVYKSKDYITGGEVTINGVSPSKKVSWSNLVASIDQIDRLHPYLTVKETFEFAWRCRSGGTHHKFFYPDTPEANDRIAKDDEELWVVHRIMDILGLTRVKDTFVGDQQSVRGVSGGEKKRVTVGEMLCIACPVICCDEISTGLDAATTFDITRLMANAASVKGFTIITSLLQPPPETVSNFDELILLSSGQVIYSGPVDDVIDHFNDLGYEIPDRMDVADWLQAIATTDGWKYLREARDERFDRAQLVQKHLTTVQMRERFYASKKGKAIFERLNSPIDNQRGVDFVKSLSSTRYANSSFNSLKLLVSREVLLWWRDKYQIKARCVQGIIMGVIAGTVFFQTESSASTVSILFQSMFYMTLGAMLPIVRQFPNRSVYYKHMDANFFPTWSYVFGRSVAAMPTAVLDAIIYGTLIYFLVGLAHNDGATIGNYFIFLLLLFASSFASGLFFSMFSGGVREVTSAQACMAVAMVLMVLFCGFTVQPDVIPSYWIWAYWINYYAWTLRSLVLNEFLSGKYDDMVPRTNYTQGQYITMQFGFSLNGEPFTPDWVWWGLLYTIAIALFCAVGSVVILKRVRFATGKSLVTDLGEEEVVDASQVEKVEIPFKRAHMTFKNIRYSVTASTSKEKLELLKGIDGIVSAGTMTALMGSSGAGKTTLMDVLSLRKTSGEIEGEVCLNGHPQEERSFRRCTGYVEQFDVQTAQLTIRETMEFSAKLRLDENEPSLTSEVIQRFLDQTLDMLELTTIQDLQVGTDATGGLSFEQMKRLSIAVELVANPSIIFLDEPTSGLDARAAAIVMRGLKRIAMSGRAVCATIHQPSIAIFSSFDYLLLLKRGGETVFFGELGEESSNLIRYLERYPATPKIQPGENPATWMLTTIGAGSANTNKKPFDYAWSYSQSRLHKECLDRIDEICAGATEENKIAFSSFYATSRKTQSKAVMVRTAKVYNRSPMYNVTRVIVSCVVAILFGSVYLAQRVPETESDMNSRINSIFIGTVFICVSAQNTVLAVFERERNMFYRHKAANMYRPGALVAAYTIAEAPFILLTSSVFVVCFYFIMGFAIDVGKFFLYWLFVSLGLATFTFAGQMWVSLLRDAETAQGIGALFVSNSVMFSGILIRPDQIPNFWIFMYWILPGHYIFEGLFMSQFYGDETPIEAYFNSSFYNCLDCTPENVTCVGTAGQWVNCSFQDFSRSHVWYDGVYLASFIILARLVTYVALINLNYRAT